MSKTKRPNNKRKTRTTKQRKAIKHNKRQQLDRSRQEQQYKLEKQLELAHSKAVQAQSTEKVLEAKAEVERTTTSVVDLMPTDYVASFVEAKQYDEYATLTAGEVFEGEAAKERWTGKQKSIVWVAETAKGLIGINVRGSKATFPTSKA